MICPTCQAAADARAPRDQHCHATPGPGARCDCQHRTDRYQPRRGFDMPAALHDGMRAAAERLLTAAPLPPMIRYLADGDQPDDTPTLIPADVMRSYEQHAADSEDHAAAVFTAIARVEAEHDPDDIIRIPRTDTCPCGGSPTNHAPNCPVHPVRLRSAADAATELLPAEMRTAGLHFEWANGTDPNADTRED